MIVRHLLPVVLAAVVGFLDCAARAENWPRFRGPTGQGLSQEKGLPLRWSRTEGVAWKTAIPGKGWSSPVVWGERIFVTATEEEGASCRVICVDRRSGKLLWNVEAARQKPFEIERKNSHATPTPTTDGQRVYAVFGSGAVVAVNYEGKVVWTNNEVDYYSRHGLGASPMLYRNRLIMPYDGSNRVNERGPWPNNSAEEKLGWQTPWDRALVVALDVATGKRVWTGRRGMSRIAHVSPLVVRVGDADQIISCAGDAIQAFDLQNGQRLWTVYSQGEGVTPSPAAGDGLVFASSGFEKTTLRAVRAGGSGDVTETHIAWEQRRGVPTQSSLLYVSPRLYTITDGGVACCFEGKSGELIWQERVGGNHSASPVYADGHIYFLSEQGETTVIKAGATFEVVSRNDLGEKCQASMAVSQGDIFIRSSDHLFCIRK